MPLTLLAVRCLSDNYAYLIHNPATGATGVVDVPEAAPVIDAMTAKGWALSDIFLTHHHYDHVDGVAELRAATGAAVWGARADAHRLPPLDHALAEGDSISFGSEHGTVLDVSGHTVGHIAFHFPDSQLAFTADSLMALGCGRLFEGTPDQMWTSLCKLAALPDDTRICSGHDYLAANAAFAESVDRDNPALAARVAGLDKLRAQSAPMAIATMAEEKATNPFLRASDPSMKSSLGMDRATDAETFAELRARKDRF
ncbi:Hydroxyacylglutathione hydrolase [Roseibaca ekhonensis]|jgi:hydroxyacylglutathione hydrolase|uniref:Hydroxyacylglutathione hydrolase n=1 Tax=Roseinatronobacter ekhonensis TaxID=254356 RepID=A0A3B0M480_9RHOB|nr:hydroxyacylglutathione hydrolase [Roseibaca ekhonensis]SUZ30941.1 Hydroxyacylglutathione hydrolase [Roseibaca ekhonensis]